ncbi:uncharacterized protein LOC120331089 [Styela clava]|uniref:uncharacterized protein LOC120331089 n=1 Tax=Styela clava TaxID=7725 RepID=UPI001939E4E7|nr:uncharacterized protein LOC120331089 [Styela clava]
MFKLLVLALVFAITQGTLGLTTDERKYFKARPYPEQNTGIQGTVSVDDDPRDAKVLILQSNGIPDHDTGTFPAPSNPNSIEVQSFNWRIPKNPTIQLETSCLPMGPIAMATNGVAIYNPFTIGCCDAGTEELDLFDMCTGHPSPSGQYHYHIFPKCLKDFGDFNSTIFGVAFDGFPIYGPEDEFGNELTNADLDACNGRTDTYGNYRYHITNEYPYFMGCYSGRVRKDVGNNVGSTTDCQCLEPVDVCTEFGGGGGGGPPPHPGQIIIDDPGDGAGAISANIAVLVMAASTAIFRILYE